MNIAVFGGSFDPPHLGHLFVAQHLLAQHYADEVWLMPVKKHAFGKYVTESEHRVALLELLAAADSQIKVSHFELDQPGTSYTYLTLSQLRSLYPQHTFMFVLGSDNLKSFNKWHQYQQLLAEFPVLVYPRVGYDHDQLLPGMTLVKNMTPVKISSTTIRNSIGSGDTISELTTPEIAAYIESHGLYKS